MSAAAGRPVAVHQFLPPSTRTTRRAPTPSSCARCCARPAGARRSSPRRSTTTWPREAYKHWMYPEHAAEGDVAVYQFTTSSAVAPLPGRARAAADPRLPQLHGPRALRRLGAGQRAARAPRAADELALLAPEARARAGQEPLQRAGAPARGLPAHGGRARAGRLRPGHGQRPTRGWRPSWPGAGPRGGADILFVGRVVPSKAQHELVKALWAYRRLYDPTARLHLVGGTSSYEYSKSLLGLRRRPRAVRRGAHRRRGLRRVAGRLLRCGRRLPLALGARGLRRAAGRGDDGRRPGRHPRRGRRGRDGGRCRPRARRRATRRTWRPPCTGPAPTTRLRADADRRGAPPRGRALQGDAAAAQFVDAIAAVVGRP